LLKSPPAVALSIQDAKRPDCLQRRAAVLRFILYVGLIGSLLLFCPALPSQAESGSSQAELPSPFSGRISPYVSTPLRVVEKMLELAEVGPDDTVYDLGSGDGRIVIMAAQKYGARAVGVEIRSELAEKSSKEIARLGLEKSARIIHGDMFETDPGRATVVTLYQLTVVNKRLRPMLEKRLRPGTRVVAVDFQIPGWTPAKAITVTSENDNQYSLFLYVRP
jgi:protein-L-isoaspartate O-methyltransferase